ncbi:methyltransferase domain-containing protein [Streptomyces sp. NPDC050423]|uniref:methyltransferase domain-containing protein n=1 Tax=Streptomyces sp. NPDC050423 TaxID=3155402 RepID=UPI00343E80A9
MAVGPRAHSFNAAADQYAAGRPSYPPALFDFVEQFTRRPLPGARVADVGAGTGIATALLRERGADVIGVEPGDAMAATFHTLRRRPIHSSGFAPAEADRRLPFDHQPAIEELEMPGRPSAR